MQSIHMTILVVGGHWALKVQDGERFHIAGSSPDRRTVEALAHKLSAECVARGRAIVFNVADNEILAA